MLSSSHTYISIHDHPHQRKGEARCHEYVVVWWACQTPQVGLFDHLEAGKAAANVRNALRVTVTGTAVEIDEVVDWYRRNDEGDPLPAEWRDGLGQPRVPWGPQLNPRPSARPVAAPKG